MDSRSCSLPKTRQQSPTIECVAYNELSRCVLLAHGQPHAIASPLDLSIAAADLRKIYEQLPVERKRSVKSTNKSQTRNYIRMALFNDYPICCQPKQELMVELSRLVNEKRKSTDNDVATPPVATAQQRGTPKLPAQTGSPSLQQLPPHMAMPPSHMYPTYPHASFPVMPMNGMVHSGRPMFPGGSAVPPYPARAPYFSPNQFMPYPNVPNPNFGFNPASVAAFASMPSTAARRAPSQASGLKRPHSCIDNNPVFVKPESSIGDPDSTPKDPHETLVCAQLQQNYGFSDVREMLTSYRRLKTNSAPTVEDVMIDIVSLREEADEAKKMDEARRQSERTRKEEAKKRRLVIQQERQVALESATFAEFRSKHFPKSWILQGSACARIERAVTSECTSLKRSLIDLLELELKAHKWYGTTLPRSYFRRVLSSTLASCVSLAETLDDRVKYLQNIMFQLSEQTKSGVPVAFRDAHDADTAIDDDDDIELVTKLDKPKTPQRQQPAAKESVDVIDLLD